jgi:glycosyltransferase involved in cell wall biosynthesis
VRYFLSEIWPALTADDPSRHVTFVGRDPPPELQAAARDPRIAVTGRVDDVRPYLDAASIYVCPIRDGGGTRLKVLDALAMARPVVATALAMEGLDIVAERHYLRAETPVEFVAQVRRLERDAALRRRLGEAGRDLVVRRYAWGTVGRKLDAAYGLAAGGARSAAATARDGRADRLVGGRR